MLQSELNTSGTQTKKHQAMENLNQWKEKLLADGTISAGEVEVIRELIFHDLNLIIAATKSVYKFL
jgi:hypothetical protein